MIASQAPWTLTGDEPAITMPAPAHGGSQADVTRVVLHDEEFPVGDKSAESIASYFSAPTTGVSAHYVVDADSVQHCVPENIVGYHAPPNQGSIGIEHDGYARFTAADWALPGSVASLARSAELTAGICRRWNIPVVYLTATELLAYPEARGITTHAQVSLAFGQSDHMDPGPDFPIDSYLAAVTAHLGGNDMPLNDIDKKFIADAVAAAAVKVIEHVRNGPGYNLATVQAEIAAIKGKLGA